jgi:hypothetical protein
VDPAKVVVILNMSPPTSAKKLFSMLGHIGYHCRFIKRYASITTPLEKLPNNSEAFRWAVECDKAFDILKEKLNTTPIIVYPN